ncbi:MAG: hypothetical protein RLZZ15_2727 [Verrucomicrobiota bacterium]|jgi:hypothetical protein
MKLHWKIDECSLYFGRLHLRGWCHHVDAAIVRVEILLAENTHAVALASFGQPSADVAAGLGPTAARARFDEWVEAPEEMLGRPFALRFWFADGSSALGEDALTNAAWGDPYFQGWENFLLMLDAFPSGAVLEIGSRARSAITRRGRIPARLDYVGLDILAGPNVDVVGDAHELARLFAGRKFVAAFSTSVFEHLAMPWKVAVDLNRVLAPGGLVYTATHQTWPIHEEPWDFWRFSKYSWTTLFNAATGFEIVEAVHGEPGRVHACRASPVTRDMPDSLVWLGSSSIVRKISETTLDWSVPLPVATTGRYPAGELSAPPR